MSSPAIVTGGDQNVGKATASQAGGGPLAGYAPPDRGHDLFTAADPALSRKWQAFADGLAQLGQGNLNSVHGWLDRHVEDLGLGYRMAGDEHERAWPLSPMPVLIGAGEWAQIERGLVQRARLLEAVIADIYGEQQLVTQGRLPAAVISGSTHFARRMLGIAPPGNRFMQFCAFDLARTPGGGWQVLADRTRLPVGIGYSLQNRLAVSRTTGGLLAAIGARRETDFFDTLRAGLASVCERAEPRIGLLTPGRFNQSYPEQAHLARHLGFSLVEGRDLVVRDSKLYVRTIAGLKRIDGLWRWINARDIDPLNFDAHSEIGVPNLVDAASHGLVLANWPGVGVVESRAMPAFLPRLSETILGEALELPNVATWWCGGEAEREHVLANMDDMVVSSAFRQQVSGLPDGRTRQGKSLSQDERRAIEDAMRRRPMDYTAQEFVGTATTPALVEGRFVPRGFVLRAFLCRDDAGEWQVMPGGFARLTEGRDLRIPLMSVGDVSADVCIVDDAASDRQVAPARNVAPAPRREQGLLPSQAADNFFWLGRYVERANQTARIVRALVEQVSIAGERAGAESAVSRLAGLLRGLSAVPPESIGWLPSRLASEALGNSGQQGSVRGIVDRARQIALLLRDRLSRDGWRSIQHISPVSVSGDLDRIAQASDEIVERLAAFARLASDGLSRGPAWHFLDIGMCLERGSMVVQSCRSLVPGSANAQDLTALLDLVDGQSLYRSRYMTMPYIAPVFDMVLLDAAQPRGLAFQMARIEEHLSGLPVLAVNGMQDPPLRLVRQLRARLEGLDAQGVTSAVIGELGSGLSKLSQEIGSLYFLQSDPGNARQEATFLA